MAPKLSAAQMAAQSADLGAILELIAELPVGDRDALAKLLKPSAAKRAMGAEAFFDAFQVARRNAGDRYGLRWVTLGYARWATLPTGLRSFKGPLGSTIKLPKDIRLPPAECWADGTIPLAADCFAVEFPRECEELAAHWRARDAAIHQAALDRQRGPGRGVTLKWADVHPVECAEAA